MEIFKKFEGMKLTDWIYVFRSPGSVRMANNKYSGVCKPFLLTLRDNFHFGAVSCNNRLIQMRKAFGIVKPDLRF